MDINKIAKKMTREEFLKGVIIDEDGQIENIKWKDSEWLCPTKPNSKWEECTYYQNCKQCWENAIKDIKFKGEDNMENKIDYDREYNIMEIMEFPAEIEIKNQYNMFYKISNNDLYYKEDENKWIKSDISLRNILNMKFKLIKKDKKVSFEEAIQAYGKEIYCKVKVNNTEVIIPYYLNSKNDSFSNAESTIITPREILEGEWYIKED
ncbi:hypothetical protein [Clostridium sporogenes]|uniref:hypothetical protein n=1 Tax=Clostridium sporogenes TaxID=1509 RepID=UPI0013D7C149|nr:hypothetical protein [Clostridium sporogenes]NFH40857.1 hypothetical protein [Clostridium sporogenes]